jgi:hypothetical protein
MVKSVILPITVYRCKCGKIHYSFQKFQTGTMELKPLDEGAFKILPFIRYIFLPAII